MNVMINKADRKSIKTTRHEIDVFLSGCGIRLAAR